MLGFQSPTTLAGGELGADARDALVPNNLVELDAGLFGLSALVLDSLFACADAGVEK
jgi:hypothetical protein